MAKLSEKHPRESEIAHTLLEPFRTRARPLPYGTGASKLRVNGPTISK